MGGTTFRVVQDETVELAVGKPIVGAVLQQASGRRHSFSQSLTGRSGEFITLTRNGILSPAPKLRIVNEDGTYDKVFSFEYG